MQQNLKNTLVDHVLVNITNLEESLKWYTSSFNCELLYKTKTLAVLKFENIKVILSLPSEQRTHLAFLKENAASFGELREQSDLCVSTFIADPSGNQIELINNSIEEHKEINNLQ